MGGGKAQLKVLGCDLILKESLDVVVSDSIYKGTLKCFV